MNYTGVFGTLANHTASPSCAFAADDVTPHPALLKDYNAHQGFSGDAHVFRNGSYVPGSPWEALEEEWIWRGVVAITSVMVLVVATWYLRHGNREICWSDGEVWAAPGKWVRPLSNLEHLFGVCASLSTMNTAQVLYLRSAQPITYDLVQQALTILAQRVLVLQLAMAWRGWWPWYRRTNTITVPLSESNEDPMVVYRRDLNLDYQVSKGPLWRATLVHQPSPCAGTYEAVLVLTIHHAVTDGTTNMILSRDLLSIINGLVTGKEAYTQRRGLVPPLSHNLLSKFDVLPALSFLLFVTWVGFCHLLTRGASYLLPPPDPVPPATSAVLHDFSKEDTAQLARRCKESGVRIHACFLAACGLAYLKTVQQNKPYLKTVKMIHETPVNIRRYYPACHEEALGTVSLQVLMEHFISEKPDFWALARIIQDDLYTSLGKDRLPLRMSRLGYTMSIIFPLNRLFSWIGLPGITYSHVLCTNMGDLRKLLPTDYDGPVNITKLIRSTAAEMMGTCLTLVTQTLGGRLLLSVDHYTTKTTDMTAKFFLDTLAQILNDIVTYGVPTDALLHQDTLTGHAKENGQIATHNNGQIPPLTPSVPALDRCTTSHNNINNMHTLATAPTLISDACFHVKSNGHIPSTDIQPDDAHDQTQTSGNIPSKGHIISNGHIASNRQITSNGHNP